MIGELHIKTALRCGTTYMETAYCTTPFKVANVTEDKKDKTLRLMLMSSSPGILDGDDHRMKVSLRKGSSLELKTQSYQRLFEMKNGASQTMEVFLEEGASFCFLPHPYVPHKSSVFTARNKVFLSDNCTLIWGEILTCGRKLCNEVFLLSRYHNLTEVFINNQLIIKENLLVEPSFIDINSIGQLENYTHQATLIYLDEKASLKMLTGKITEFLSAQKEIIYGVTAAPKNGLIIRLLGFKAEQLLNIIKTVAHNHLTNNLAYAK